MHYVSALEKVKYIRAFEILMRVKLFTTQEIGGQMKLECSTDIDHIPYQLSAATKQGTIRK